MKAFYFDVAGVLIPDNFAPGNAMNVFRELGRRYGFDSAVAHEAYIRLQPSLDLGETSLAYLCGSIGIEQELFERDWLAMHPVDREVLSLIERLAARGHAVGLATNFCRRLLDLLIAKAGGLSRPAICCSSDVGVAKPSSAFFDCATRIMNSSKIVFVDDRAVNVDAAQRFGWTAIQADHGWLPRFEQAYLLGDSEA